MSGNRCLLRIPIPLFGTLGQPRHLAERETARCRCCAGDDLPNSRRWRCHTVHKDGVRWCEVVDIVRSRVWDCYDLRGKDFCVVSMILLIRVLYNLNLGSYARRLLTWHQLCKTWLEITACSRAVTSRQCISVKPHLDRCQVYRRRSGAISPYCPVRIGGRVACRQSIIGHTRFISGINLQK